MRSALKITIILLCLSFFFIIVNVFLRHLLLYLSELFIIYHLIILYFFQNNRQVGSYNSGFIFHIFQHKRSIYTLAKQINNCSMKLMFL